MEFKANFSYMRPSLKKRGGGSGGGKKEYKLTFEGGYFYQAWWHTPVISAFWISSSRLVQTAQPDCLLTKAEKTEFTLVFTQPMLGCSQ